MTPTNFPPPLFCWKGAVRWAKSHFPLGFPFPRTFAKNASPRLAEGPPFPFPRRSPPPFFSSSPEDGSSSILVVHFPRIEAAEGPADACSLSFFLCCTCRGRPAFIDREAIEDRSWLMLQSFFPSFSVEDMDAFEALLLPLSLTFSPLCFFRLAT